MPRYQIFVSIGDGPLQRGRIYEDISDANEALLYEEEMAQQGADYSRKHLSVELHEIEKRQMLSHKRFMPRILIQ